MQLVLRLPSRGDPRRVRGNLQLLDIGNIRFQLVGQRMKRFQRLQIGQQLHQFTIHHRRA